MSATRNYLGGRESMLREKCIKFFESDAKLFLNFMEKHQQKKKKKKKIQKKTKKATVNIFFWKN